MFNNISIIEGDDLRYLLARLADAEGIYRVRINVHPNGKTVVKVNEETWTPPLGGPDKH